MDASFASAPYAKAAARVPPPENARQMKSESLFCPAASV